MDKIKVYNWFEWVCSQFPSDTVIKAAGVSISYEALKNKVDIIEQAVTDSLAEKK